MMRTMGAFLGLLAFLFLSCLIVLASMHPQRSTMSLRELKRRAKTSEAATLELDRYELYPGMVTILRSARAMTLVLTTSLLIGYFGWFFGIVGAGIVALIYPVVARLPILQKWAGRLYGAIEPSLLDFVARFESIVHAFREPAMRLKETPPTPHSREELIEIIERAEAVLNKNERQLVGSALAFPSKTVEVVMTPRSVIDAVKSTEFIGPLVLDELHSLGHSRLPVIEEDLDHIVGVLHLRDMLSLDVRESKTAKQLMEKKVYYIRHDDTLQHALAAFIKTRHHLFIVINENRETVGLLSLEDIVEALIGQKIVDQDDLHADLRSVAARAAQTNNRGESAIDL